LLYNFTPLFHLQCRKLPQILLILAVLLQLLQYYCGNTIVGGNFIRHPINMDLTKENYRLSIDNVKEATQVIDPVFLNSPQFISDTLSELFSLTLVVKLETSNPVRCFKGRGAEVFVSKALPDTHFVCASAGNFGQAMAYSCKKRKLQLTVYASKNANPFKLDRMKSLGATIVQFGEDFDCAKLEAKRISKELNATFIEDSQNIESLEGAATIGLELLKFPAKIDIVLIALGNGALFNGIARVIKYYSPKTKIIAIQAEGASAMVDSWRTSSIVNYETSNTIADGIAVRLPIPQALKDMTGLVDEALLVNDNSIINGMKLIHQHLGIVSEPSGAVGIAAILENPIYFKNQTIATVICGGNLTTQQLKLWLTH
jgi:threonine dehydratase